MLLAEALARRADLNNKEQELVARIAANAQHEEAASPDVDPQTLWAELQGILVERERLIFVIQRTNLQTQVEFEDRRLTLTEAILLRERLQREWSGKSASIAGRRGGFLRVSREDVRFVPAMDQHRVRQTLDRLAARKRRLESVIQQTNWTVELV